MTLGKYTKVHTATVNYKPHDPILSASGGQWIDNVFHVEQGTNVTIQVADEYFYPRNDFGIGSILLGSNQSIYSVSNSAGTYTYYMGGNR